MATYHLLLFDYVENVVERRAPFREAHLARIYAERDAGRIVLAGAIGEPPNGGAIVFKDVDRGEVEAFARTDVYMDAGLITRWRIEPYHVVT